ncbi:hypothetical protein KM799_15145 [Clostridium tyrobutyricum]|uniref:hypothetical protein n=1 Tax=Clostridium tyrobutyricum TaxID=1519 RepID=UPI001C3850C3|nr:hypothetical protein [Clostridium tyrobutyricum]MBV4447925.1 hypothetical protein [Clostridium tyrobutyricum]
MSKSIVYKYSFKIAIRGCLISAVIDDCNVLEKISEKKQGILVKYLKFSNDGKYITTLTGKMEAENNNKGCWFINYQLRYKIINCLLILKDLQELIVDDEVKFNIENKNELKNHNIVEHEKRPIYLDYYEDKHEINKDEIINSLKKLSNISEIKSTNKFGETLDNCLFYLYLSYNIKSQNNFDYIIKYRFLWSAFNSLYNYYSNMKIKEEKSGKSYRGKCKFITEKCEIQIFSKRRNVIKNFNKIFYPNNKLMDKLKIIMLENLELRGKNPRVSENLCLSIEIIKNIMKPELEEINKDRNIKIEIGGVSPEIAKKEFLHKREKIYEKQSYDKVCENTLLCLYAIRNLSMHGSFIKPELYKIAFEILHPIIVDTINELLKSK